MKTKFTIGEFHDKGCARFVAVINRSAKLGIPRRYQKTWRTPYDKERCQYDESQLSAMFLTAAKRWEEATLNRIKNGEVVEPEQVEAFEFTTSPHA